MFSVWTVGLYSVHRHLINKSFLSAYAKTAALLPQLQCPHRRQYSIEHSGGKRVSYAHGVSSTPLLHETIGQVLERRVEKHPDKTLFVFSKEGVRKTYQEFYQDVVGVASGFVALGLEKGDRVGMWGPNTYEWVVTQFATALAGLVMANINPAYQVEELEYCLKKVGVKAVVAASAFKTQDYHKMLTSLCPEMESQNTPTLRSERLPELRNVIMLDETPKRGSLLWKDVLEVADGASEEKMWDRQKRITPDDPVNIQFTSGTTGFPKGTALSHNGILNNAFFIGRRGGYHETDHVICCPPPLYHCFGCVAGSLGSVVHGATCVFPSPSYEPLPTLQAIQQEQANLLPSPTRLRKGFRFHCRPAPGPSMDPSCAADGGYVMSHRCTSLYGTPVMFIDLLDHKDFAKYKYDSLATGIMAGAPCPVEVCKALITKMHMKDFCLAYGATETSPVSLMTERTDDVESRVKSVGTVLEHVEVKVVDEAGVAVERGQSGELWVRGYLNMLGYWDDPEKTAEVLKEDRWFRSGDLALMNEAGKVSIVGRMKDMVIRGGENIYPTEVEKFLHTHPAIADVQVVGVPDERMGEELCAWVRLKDDGEASSVEDIKGFCKGKVSHFKVPRYILFKKLEDFPVTITGKIQKFKIKELSTVELGLQNVKTNF